MSFFGMGPMELLVIVTIAFIIFGPEKMTEIMGGLGRAVREFRSMTSGLTGEFERTMSEVRETAGDLQSLTRESLTVEGLNPFEQPSSPAAIAAHQAMVAEGNGYALEPAVSRPSRSLGPTPTKADPLADFAAFSEQAPVSPSAPPAAGETAGAVEATANEPLAEAEVLAPAESTNGYEAGTVVAGLMPAAAAGEMAYRETVGQDAPLGPTLEGHSAETTTEPRPTPPPAPEPTAEAEGVTTQPDERSAPAPARSPEQAETKPAHVA